MFLSLIELGPEAEREPEFWREVASPYGAHRAIWRLFSRSAEQKRDFLFRQEVGEQGRPRFFALSQQEPNGQGGGLWRVTTKPFRPKLGKGDRVRFMLRASPTVRRPKAKGERSQRHDLMMDAKRRARADGKPFELEKAIQAEGERWLARHGEKAGFELDRGPATSVGEDGLLEDEERAALRVDGYRQHRMQRKGQAPIQFSTVDLEGVLVVRNPEMFLRQVGQGFGPQRAFGCGLMLLRRA